VAEFVEFTLDDGSVVRFESDEGDLVTPRADEPVVTEGGRLTDRLQEVAKAAEQIAGTLRSRLAPDEVSMEFGLKVSGEVNWWFFAKAHSEGAIKVTLSWAPSGPAAAPAPAPDS
jgi:Trypsin-co-occurring domain 1